MSLYFTNVNRSTDQISLKFFVFCTKSDYSENIFAYTKDDTTILLKGFLHSRSGPLSRLSLCNWQVFQNKSNNFFYLKLFDPPNFKSILLHFLCFAPGWLGYGSILSRLKKCFFYHVCKIFTKTQNTRPVPLMMSDFEKCELTSMSWLLPIFAIFECFQSYSFSFTSPLMFYGLNYFKIPMEASHLLGRGFLKAHLSKNTTFKPIREITTRVALVSKLSPAVISWSSYIVGKNRLYSVNFSRTRCVLVVHLVHLN